MSFKYTTNISLIGRVDFLIESTAFVVVPQYLLNKLVTNNEYDDNDI